jgi:hypothetical protein
LLALLEDRLGPAIMYIGWRQPAQSAVMMLVVVLEKEDPGPVPSILLASEAIRVIRQVLQGLELGFGVGIIIGNVRAGVGFSHAQVSHQQSNWFGGHRAAPVSMDGELVRLDSLPGAGFSDQFLRQAGRLPFRDQPTDHKATEDIQDDIQVVVGPFGWPQALGDVPTPQLS